PDGSPPPRFVPAGPPRPRWPYHDGVGWVPGAAQTRDGGPLDQVAQESPSHGAAPPWPVDPERPLRPAAAVALLAGFVATTWVLARFTVWLRPDDVALGAFTATVPFYVVVATWAGHRRRPYALAATFAV